MTNARIEKKLKTLKAARAAQIHDFIRDLPDGYETADTAAEASRDAFDAAIDAYLAAAAAARDAAWDAYCAKLNKTQEENSNDG
jgi:hypothetical protein